MYNSIYAAFLKWYIIERESRLVLLGDGKEEVGCEYPGQHSVVIGQFHILIMMMFIQSYFIDIIKCHKINNKDKKLMAKIAKAE